MEKTRSDAEQQVAELLRTAKESLQLSVAFLSRLDGTTQHMEVVESSVPFLFQEGNQQRQEATFCQAILERRLPEVIPDVRRYPEAMKLPAARLPRIRSYVSVPAAAVVIEPGLREEARRRELLGRLEPVVAGGGPVVVLQPIVDLATGARVGS